MQLQFDGTKVRHHDERFNYLTKDCSQLPSNKKFDSEVLMETSNVMVLIFDSSDRVCYVNSLVETVTGYTNAALSRNTELLPQLRFFQRQRLATENSGAASNCEISLLTKHGDRCWLNCSIQTTEFDRQPATLVTAVDITPYKQDREQVLQIQREKMRSGSNMEFASMISHELRTPLNIILFSTNLLKQYCDRSNTHRKQEYFNRIERAIETITLLIDEVSIIGKAEARTIKFEPQKIELQKFCQTLLEDLQLANCNNSQVNFSIEGNLSAFLDKTILQLVLTNLIENAIKYSPQGQTVYFTVTASLDRVTFKIKDYGIGIAREDLQKLFEPFYRGNNVGELPGNGLGLAVVKKLIDLHGGEISVNTQVGMGTEFVVSLPKQN